MGFGTRAPWNNPDWAPQGPTGMDRRAPLFPAGRAWITHVPASKEGGSVAPQPAGPLRVEHMLPSCRAPWCPSLTILYFN